LLIQFAAHAEKADIRPRYDVLDLEDNQPETRGTEIRNGDTRALIFV
jgi:hypothetical protein